MPWPSSVNALAGPGRSTTRGGACASPKTVMLPGAAGSLPGARTASRRVPASNTAAAAWAGSGRTAPAGDCDGGGDTAAAAGSMVRGAPASGFDEQPTVAPSKTARLNTPP